MPSIDEDLLLRLHDSGKLLCIAEQNNGFIWQNYLKVLFRRRKATVSRVLTINTLDADGKPQFIHSGNYDELLNAFGLAPAQIAASIQRSHRDTLGVIMSVPLIHESDVEELDLPGRHLRWLVNKERLSAQHLSMCVIRVQPGKTVKPAHSHPNGEEVIYILSGSGRVYVDGAIDSVRAGTAVLFPQGAIHMLQNTGDRRDEGGLLFRAGDRPEQLQILRTMSSSPAENPILQFRDR